MVDKGDTVTFASSKKHPPLEVLSVNYSWRGALVRSKQTGRKFGLRFERMALLERAK